MAHTSERIPILTSDTGTDVKEEKKVSVPAKSSGDDGGRSDGSSSQEKSVSQLNTTLQPLSENLFKSLPTEIIVRILSYLTPHELAQSTSCCREVGFKYSVPGCVPDFLCSGTSSPRIHCYGAI
jgi:hypothetical protein